MYLKRVFPYALSVSLLCAISYASAQGQALETRPRQVATTTTIHDNATRLESDLIVTTAPAIPAESRAQKPLEGKTPLASPLTASGPRLTQLNQMLLAAIDNRLGARYVYGASGPSVFDCSGFVWSVFQSAGINFERSSARTLWTRFQPARPEEEFKFGTLVFFNNLGHVGIVADENGFYHASRSHGVVYSTFSDYWMSRLDGFRRVPLPSQPFAE